LYRRRGRPQVCSGGVQKISLPADRYPAATCYADWAIPLNTRTLSNMAGPVVWSLELLRCGNVRPRDSSGVWHIELTANLIIGREAIWLTTPLAQYLLLTSKLNDVADQLDGTRWLLTAGSRVPFPWYSIWVLWWITCHLGKIFFYLNAWMFRSVLPLHPIHLFVCHPRIALTLISVHIFSEYPQISNVHENPSTGSRVVPCGRMHGLTKNRTYFSQFCEMNIYKVEVVSKHLSL
jgi:hypothetical protein